MEVGDQDEGLGFHFNNNGGDEESNDDNSNSMDQNYGNNEETYGGLKRKMYDSTSSNENSNGINEEQEARRFMENQHQMEMDAASAFAEFQQLQQEAAEAEQQEANENNSSEPVEQMLSTSIEGPTPAKKPLLEINVRKLLPDLEKHWKAVEDDPSDFTAWTYLLQYVDQENELLAAREAYDGFLSRYPYCYGYWKKFADYEKRKGSAEDCEEVFRRGLRAIPLSVDLWIHYLNYVKASHDQEEDYIRAQYDSAIETCGMEFRSDKLWEHYLHWEKDERKNTRQVMAIYDKLLATPTQNYQNHVQGMKDFVNQNAPAEMLSVDEYLEIKSAIDSSEDKVENEEEETNKLREKIIEKRMGINKENEAEITARWAFEEAIKRPYFHVKPLEKGQLKNWKEYLNFEIGKGNNKRIVTLFERCLIACALYEEYWMKYVKYLESQPIKDLQAIREIFIRGCTIHHSNKPWINLHWAAFEELQGNVKKASEILEKLDKASPDSLHVYYRRINLERRTGNMIKCKELFEKCIKEGKNAAISVQVTLKYARFLTRLGEYEKAIKLLRESINKEESTRPKVIMALIDIGMQQVPMDFELILGTFDEALKSEISNEQKVTFAHRKIEFLEDYCNDIASIEKSHDELQTIAKLLREKSAEEKTGGGSEENKSATPYGQQYNQYGQYANWNYQQPSHYGSYSQSGTTPATGPSSSWSAYQGYYE